MSYKGLFCILWGVIGCFFFYNIVFCLPLITFPYDLCRSLFALRRMNQLEQLQHHQQQQQQSKAILVGQLKLVLANLFQASSELNPAEFKHLTHLEHFFEDGPLAPIEVTIQPAKATATALVASLLPEKLLPEKLLPVKLLPVKLPTESITTPAGKKGVGSGKSLSLSSKDKAPSTSSTSTSTSSTSTSTSTSTKDKATAKFRQDLEDNMAASGSTLMPLLQLPTVSSSTLPKTKRSATKDDGLEAPLKRAKTTTTTTTQQQQQQAIETYEDDTDMPDKDSAAEHDALLQVLQQDNNDDDDPLHPITISYPYHFLQ